MVLIPTCPSFPRVRHSRNLVRHSRNLVRHSRNLVRHSRNLVRHSRVGGNPVITRTPLDSRLRGNDLCSVCRCHVGASAM